MDYKFLITTAITVGGWCVMFGVYKQKIKNLEDEQKELKEQHAKDVESINARFIAQDSKYDAINDKLSDLGTKMDLLLAGRINLGEKQLKNYPQTFAIDVAENIKAIGKWGCLAMGYLWCIGLDGDCSDYVRSVSNAMNYSAKLPKDQQFIDSECTVLDAAKYLEYHSGKKFKVLKKNISDLSEIKEPAMVRFTYNGACHWVGVENGMIAFNSLANSLCVTKGKLDQNPKNPNTRIIKIGE